MLQEKNNNMGSEEAKEFIELYKALLSNQISNHTITVTALLTITVILLGVQWVINKQKMEASVKKAVEKKSAEMEIKLRAELNKQMALLEKSTLDMTEREFLHFQRRTSIMSAAIQETQKSIHGAFAWVLKALESSIKENKEIPIRSLVDALLHLKKKLEAGNTKDSSFSSLMDYKTALEIIESIPDMLNKEKDILKEFVNINQSKFQK